MIRLYGALCATILLTAGGCGGSDLVPAGGKLTQGGTPVTNATVMLHYPSNDFCVGSTDSQGLFTLTYNGKPGARPGKQIGVTVTKYDSVDSGETKLPAPVGAPPVSAGPSPTPTKVRAATLGKNLLPAEYGDPKKPKLKIDVPEGGTDKLDIALP